MCEQQNNRDRDQKMMFFMQGVPTNRVNMNQLPKWIRNLRLLCLWLDDTI